MKTITINSSPNQIKETLKWMTHFQKKYLADPDWVELSRHIARSSGAHTPEAEVEAVRLWVRYYCDFRNDPAGVEYLQDPLLMIDTRAGDCDDLACLAGVLLINLGHDCYPAAVCWAGDEMPSHAVCMDDSTGLICDPVQGVPARFWPEPPYQVGRWVTVGR